MHNFIEHLSPEGLKLSCAFESPFILFSTSFFVSLRKLATNFLSLLVILVDVIVPASPVITNNASSK